MAKKKVVKDPKSMMSESPTVVGMMSAVIESGGSLDTAVREVAKTGPRMSAALFGDVVRRTDTRAISDIKSGMSSFLMSLPDGLSSFRRAIHMVMAASDSSNRGERARMLKDASDISLVGLKEVGETYGSSLNTPCMAVFGLGIMVPMILMSILPMLNIGGMFGSSPISPEMVALITLVIIPAVIVAVILSIKEKNPFMAPVRYGSIKNEAIYPALLGIPAALVAWFLTSSVQMAVTAAFVCAGAGIFAVMHPEVVKEKKRAKQEQFLKDSVFDLGNRLIAGENFETALIQAVGTRKECKPLAEALEREIMMCRGDICAAIRTSLSATAPRVAGIFCDIRRCAMKDLRDAGRLAVSIGRQLQDQDVVVKGIENKLKSMTDMMVGTAMVFAPLVLGMSVAMLSPLATIAKGADPAGTSMMLSMYLGELCVLMSFLTAYLNGRPEPKDIIYRIGMMLPVSMIMFTLCMNIRL